MRAIVALLILGVSFIAGCDERRRPDVLDGGEPLYIAQCATQLPGLACE